MRAGLSPRPRFVRTLPALMVALLASGCLGQLRAALVEHEQLSARYATQPHPVSLEDWARFLDTRVRRSGCPSIVEPCLATRDAPSPDILVFCLDWGANRNCYEVWRAGAGTVLVERPPVNIPLFHWIVERIDADGYALARAEARASMEEQLAREEAAGLAASSFWGQAHFTARFNEGVGFHLRGGYRRWFQQHLLLSLGPGYERSFHRAAIMRDALSLSARLELSSYDRERQPRLLNLPLLSVYLGVTGMLGVAPELSGGVRGYVGLSTIALVSAEVGVTTLYGRSVVARPALYFGVGLGL